MAKEIFMPKLSSTMSVGTLIQWFKEEGDSVEIGEPLFEILTDKIEIEVEAYEEGILLKKYFKQDDEVPVNQIIGYIGEADEQVPDSSPGQSASEHDESDEEIKQSQPAAAEQSSTPEEKVRATPAARRIAKENDLNLSIIQGSGPNGRVQQQDLLDYLNSDAEKVKITPLAQKIAKEQEIDISTLKGTGSNGKITKQDIIPSSAESQTAMTSARRKMSGIRKVISKRMLHSVQSVPHVTLTSEIDMTNIKELRQSLLPIIEKQTDLRITYTDILVKAVGSAMTRHPQINISIDGDEIIQHSSVNIGVAVAIEDGLIVPVIHDAAHKGLAEIVKQSKQLGKLARSNQLTSENLTGATFTISNLGMYAIDAFTPIINLPEIAILGVGRIQEKPVVVNGSIEVRSMMAVSLSFDHRAIDGAPAAAFLTELKQILENPYELLV
ncbi:dihydrolipoamide acetyltransferase family protein [Cytobacillus gottheilii]|uniref:Dihydrolipoamide acetyltransferase component of pyruvate dehydrogenase complex n=1 Tax=Cytobacillus gottheilii TaxID=859144 RepID=A0ABX8F8M3_9BACI|nr:dihydrolipoamide acetyltransferase family protein [Cytobacillus gottheilii]QVY60768.1 2-oxo acid dehydrogenase subunit E2 [Cytobacillus gottheilii]